MTVIGATAAAAAAAVWCDALFTAAALSPPVKLWWPLFELLLLLALALVFVVVLVVTALPPLPPAPAPAAAAVPPVASLDGGGRYSGRSGRLFSASISWFSLLLLLLWFCCCDNADDDDNVDDTDDSSSSYFEDSVIGVGQAKERQRWWEKGKGDKR